MILHDYRCTKCGTEQERFCKQDEIHLDCVKCGEVAYRVILKAPQPDWAGLAMGDSASPEAISHFERTHKQQRAKEEKSLRENGDYGPAPGSDGGNSYRGN